MKNYIIEYDHFNKGSLNFRESILTIGNTYMGLRGIEDECPSSSLPGLYIAGLFDKSECLVPEIVNFPNFTTMYAVVDGAKVSADNCEIVKYSRWLDMKDGTLHRDITYKTEKGKIINIESCRFLSFYDLNCGAVIFKVKPENFTGEIEIITEHDASALSREGSYHYDENVKHFYTKSINDQYEENFHTRLILRDSGYYVDIASCMVCEGTAINKRRRRIYGEKVIEAISVNVEEGKSIDAVKYFTVTDSRDTKDEFLGDICLSRLERMKSNGFNEELQRSSAILSCKWEKADVKIDGDEENDLALRFNIYNLIVLGNEHSSRFAIGAKGLSTEHYGGHYFWDTEVYLTPFYINTFPAVAKNLLKFRYNTLEVAKKRAVEGGFEGCLWPWQSDADGLEGIRQTVKDNGVVERRQILDQYHIVSDVAFTCFKLLYKTGDEYFFRTYLCPLVVEGMRFWRSFLIKTNPPGAEKLEIKNVMGPDEYHTCLNNNYYTNYMTKKVFQQFFEYLEQSDDKAVYDIKVKNGLSEEELKILKETGEKIYLPEIVNGVIEQFDGYFGLRDIVINQYNEKGLPLYPDPDVGKGLPDAERQDALQSDATTTQLIKQADAVLTICQDSHGFSLEQMQATFDYYLKRTLQFSSLSPGTYAFAGAMAKCNNEAFRLFELAVNMDLKDIKKETETGLHTACHGGAYQSVVEGFAGVRGEKDYLVIDPLLPADWKSIEFKYHYKGNLLKLIVGQQETKVQMLNKGELKIKYQGEYRSYYNNTEEPLMITL